MKCFLLSIDTTFDSFRGVSSPIETILNGILHRLYRESLLTGLLDPLTRLFLNDAWTNKAALGVLAIKKQDLSIDTNFEQFCEN